MTGNKFYKIICILILISLPISYSFPIAQVLSWAVSVEDGNWVVMASDTVVPGAGKMIGFVVNPEGAILGEGVTQLKETLGPDMGRLIDGALNPKGALTQASLEAIAKNNPESAGALSQILTVKSQLDQLGFKDGSVEFDKSGKVKEISEFQVKEGNLEDVSTIVGAEEDSFRVSGVSIAKENGITTIKPSGNEPAVFVKSKSGEESIYKNMDPGSFLKFNEEGTLIEAEILTKKELTIYDFGDKKIQLMPNELYAHKELYTKGVKINYKNNIIELAAKDPKGASFNVYLKEYEDIAFPVKLFGFNSKVAIDGNSYSGNDFSITKSYEDAYLVPNEIKIIKGSLTIEDKNNFILKEKTKLNLYDREIAIGEKAAKLTLFSVKDFEIKLTGEDITFKSADNNIIKDYSFTGSIGFDDYSKMYKLYGGTIFSENWEDNEIIYSTQKDLYYHLLEGSCFSSSNCIERSGDSLFMNSRDDNNLIIEDTKGSIKNMVSRRIADNSKTEFIQNGVKIKLSKEPYAMEGNMDNLIINNLETTSGVGDETRIYTLKRDANSKMIVSEYCSPCNLGGDLLNPITKIRLNALSITDKEKVDIENYYLQKYNVKPQRLFGYFDDSREESLIKNYLDVFNKYPNLDPALYLSAANREGLLVWIDTYYYDDGPEKPINGFTYLGLDTFGSNVKKLKNGGCGINLNEPCLRQDFNDFEVKPYTNELNEKVKSADFKNLNAGLEAFGAVLWQRQSKFIYDAKKMGINTNKLNSDEISYWTYYYYNMGEGQGKKDLIKSIAKKEASLLPNKKLSRYVTKSDGTSGASSQFNAMTAAATADFIKKTGLLDIQNPSIIAIK